MTNIMKNTILKSKNPIDKQEYLTFFPKNKSDWYDFHAADFIYSNIYLYEANVYEKKII